MTPWTKFVYAAALASAVVLTGASPSFALSAKECSAKYNAAKADGSLGKATWNEFRQAQCGDDAATATTATKTDAKPATTAGANGATFPKSVDPKYATQSASKARFRTCLDQYKANKAANANGGMKWIQKGGGYYSLCNKALKA